MPRQYTKLKGIESEVYRLKEDGLTNREIAAYFGVTREQILLPRKPMKMKKCFDYSGQIHNHFSE